MDGEKAFVFLICLGSGLWGLCITMRTLLDTLLSNWNPFDDLQWWINHSWRRQTSIEWKWERTIPTEYSEADLNRPLHNYQG
jgi:hypothetical protein